MNDDDFLKQTKKTLDDSVESLDAATLSKLNQARQKALDSKRHSNFFSGALPASGFAMITIAILVGWLWYNQTPENHLNDLANNYEDIEILTSDTELELLEDMDFVSWLMEEDFMEETNAG